MAEILAPPPIREAGLELSAAANHRDLEGTGGLRGGHWRFGPALSRTAGDIRSGSRSLCVDDTSYHGLARARVGPEDRETRRVLPSR